MGLELEESVAYQAWNQESEDESGKKGDVARWERYQSEDKQEDAEPIILQNR